MTRDAGRGQGGFGCLAGWLLRAVMATIACAAMLAATAGTAGAQQNRIAGTVQDTSGAAVAGAQVEVRAGAYSAATTTDNSGAFAFNGVTGTMGSVTVMAKGFARAEKSWSARDVRSGAALRIVLAPQAVEQRVVVTAARAATSASDFGGSVVQLSSDDLKSTPAVTLDERLEQIPGFSLFRRSTSRTANPTTEGVSLRGLAASGASRALVLEDGIPLNDPFGGWVHWDLVPNEAVASAEVTQEGASSLYGSDALAGVIQFLTRPPQPAGIAIQASYGNENTPNLSLWTGGQKGKWNASFGGELFRTGGYVQVPEAERGTVDIDAGSKNATADLTVGRTFGGTTGIHGSVFARGWYLGELRENGTPLQTNDTHLGQGAVGANLELGRAGSLVLRVYGNAETYHQNFSSIAAGRNSEALTDAQTVPAQSVGASAVWSRAVGKRQTLVAGVDTLETTGHSHEIFFTSGAETRTSSVGGQQRNVGVFGEDLIQITPRWFLAVSARFDDWRNFNAASQTQPAGSGAPTNISFPTKTYTPFDPRINATYQLRKDLSWSASMYRAFRAPTLNELYRQFRQGNVLTEANSDLIAERLTGGETGLAYSALQDRVEVHGSFFFNEMIDPVANVTLSSTPTLITRQRQNLGRTHSPGFAIDARARVTRRLDLSGGYQYVDAVVTQFPGNAALVGLWIAQTPHNALTFQVHYSAPGRFDISADGRMVGQQFDDDQNAFPLGRFFVLDAMASRPMGRGMELFASVENMLNEKYAIEATPLTETGLPITVQGGFRWELFQKQ